MQETSMIPLAFIVLIVLLGVFVSFVAVMPLFHQKYRSNFEKEVLKIQLELHEQTLHNISLEIHDNVGQYLTLAKLRLNTLALVPKSKEAEIIDDVSGLLTKALDDLRDLSRSLSVELIKAEGLEKAIEYLVGQLKKAGLYGIDFEMRGIYHFLEVQKEIILFRILQEAVNNILRHALATRITIFLDCTEAEVSMTVSDNGRGFDTAKYIHAEKGGLRGGGINNMMVRAGLIDAAFFIESIPGNGTKVRFTIPYTPDYATNI